MTISLRLARPGGRGSRSAPLPREVWILSWANIMIALGYGVVAPAMPHLARRFGVSIEAVMFLVTVFSLSRLCFAPVSGALVQRWGERRIYINGLLVVAVSTMACAFSQTYWQLLLFRVVSGVGSTLFYVSALGLMIHISPVDARGRVAGIFTTSFMVGVVCGPAIGGLGASLGLAAPFIIYGAVLLGVAVVLVYSLRNSAADRASAPDTYDGDDARGAAVSRVSVCSAVQFCDRLVGVRASCRAGPAVHLRRHGPRRRDHRPGARDVRRR